MSIGRDFIGPFQLLRLIRAGTTTQVWEAMRTGESERIALKVLMKDFRTDKYEIGQLKHEALVGADLDHPNVIKIFDYHDEQGYPLISMQLFPSKTAVPHGLTWRIAAQFFTGLVMQRGVLLCESR